MQYAEKIITISISKTISSNSHGHSPAQDWTKFFCAVRNSSLRGGAVLLHLVQRDGVEHWLDDAAVRRGDQNSVGLQPERDPLRRPYPRQRLQHLVGEHLLAEVVAALDDGRTEAPGGQVAVGGGVADARHLPLPGLFEGRGGGILRAVAHHIGALAAAEGLLEAAANVARRHKDAAAAAASLSACGRLGGELGDGVARRLSPQAVDRIV
ncbi:hypothetical protein TYRP_001077 [Tyrophagus putrescentiae]|nr:hypothetical protein TYRP_001077 [Tyrophagus putrescentiae]